MLKLFDLMFSTCAGKLAMRGIALLMLLALVVLVVLAPEMPLHVILADLASALFVLTLTFKDEISRHRGSIAYRACELLPIAQRAVNLVFALLTVPVRFYAAPARARPRPSAGRFGRLPAVTLSPRLLPIPSASA